MYYYKYPVDAAVSVLVCEIDAYRCTHSEQNSWEWLIKSVFLTKAAT